MLAAKYHGVGTLADLADYHRQGLTAVKPLIQELVAEGRLREVQVADWSKPAYLHPEARRPREVHARAFLSPFDPLVWFRERSERLFGFHYRIEIYTPKPKRVYGYYVLPFVFGEDIVGRFDLKADRHNSTLLVQGSFTEPGVPSAEVAAAAAAELALMAGWLGLERVEVKPNGDLANRLAEHF